MFSLSGGVWSQVGNKLVGSGAGSSALQGMGVTICADAITIAVGGPGDTGGGSVWIFTLSGSSYLQQGGKFTANPTSTQFGTSVALAADSTTLVVGADGDSGSVGAMFVFTRNATGVWSQQGEKNEGRNSVSSAIYLGRSVAISANGNIAAVGGVQDSNSIGATWIFTRNTHSIWAQYGIKLVGSGFSGSIVWQGDYNTVSLSADGTILLVGGEGDNSNIGAAWAFADFFFTPCTRPTSKTSITYSSCSSSLYSGTICTPSCTTNYTANSNLSIICNNGTMSTPLGTCYPNCLTLFTPLAANANYGNCTANFASGRNCSIECTSNALLTTGSTRAACSNAGVWTLPTAVCTLIGAIFGLNQVHSRVVFSIYLLGVVGIVVIYFVHLKRQRRPPAVFAIVTFIFSVTHVISVFYFTVSVFIFHWPYALTSLILWLLSTFSNIALTLYIRSRYIMAANVIQTWAYEVPLQFTYIILAGFLDVQNLNLMVSGIYHKPCFSAPLPESTIRKIDFLSGFRVVTEILPQIVIRTVLIFTTPVLTTGSDNEKASIIVSLTFFLMGIANGVASRVHDFFFLHKLENLNKIREFAMK